MKIKDKRLQNANQVEANNMESALVYISITYLCFAFWKGETLTEALEQLNLKLPKGVSDNWNDLDIESFADITIQKKVIQITRKHKLKAFFTIEHEDEYDA